MFLKPGMEEEYHKRHDKIWPEPIRQLRREGVYARLALRITRPQGGATPKKGRELTAVPTPFSTSAYR